MTRKRDAAPSDAPRPPARRTPRAGRADSTEGLRSARVLCVVPPKARKDLAQHLEGKVQSLVSASSADHALGVAGAGAFDLILVADTVPDADGPELIDRLARLCPSAALVMVSDGSDLDDAVEAMRRGASEIASWTDAPARLVARLEAALARARQQRRLAAHATRRVDRLRRLCRALNLSRHDLQTRLDVMRRDIAAHKANTQHAIEQTTLASEFGTLVRQELDVESLLRSVLEYVLPKTGPTNAAVFLPSSSGDYSLGAYVNYDVPKDTAEVLLETLAGVIAPEFDEDQDVSILATRESLESRLGEDTYWLENASLCVLPCLHEGECLAVVALFRDRACPFPESLLSPLRIIREIFARQLARIIRTHHRHLPKHKWGSLGDDGDGLDDLDLAA